MRYYQELTLLPSFDIPLSFVWSKVYQQLHLGLVQMQDENGGVPYGVSFPQYRYNNGKGAIGEKLRIFARSEEELVALGIKRWLERMVDYVHVTGVREVPERIEGYAVYQRMRQENNAEQKARRYLMRHQGQEIRYEEVVAMFSKKKRQTCNLPYIQQKSLTNHNPFRLHIEKKLYQGPVYDGFGTYGLSDTSTVPEF